MANASYCRKYITNHEKNHLNGRKIYQTGGNVEDYAYICNR